MWQAKRTSPIPFGMSTRSAAKRQVRHSSYAFTLAGKVELPRPWSRVSIPHSNSAWIAWIVPRACRRLSTRQSTSAPDKSMPSERADMVVQKATVLAKDYLRAKERDASSGWVQASQHVAAPSQGKDVQRHTAKALRNLQDELANTAQLFDGSARGDVARRIGAAVERVRKECGPDEALRIASQGIDAVRLASTKLATDKYYASSRTHRLI